MLNANKETRPKVVVLMSTFNGEKFLNKQINSILSQKGVDINLIIRDDRSKDDTVKILQEISSCSDAIKVLYGEENIGACKSFLSLLFEGDIDGFDYIAFADQDDVWDADKIISGIKLIGDSYEPTLYYSVYKIHNILTNESHIAEYKYNPDFYESLLTSRYCGCTMILNKEGVNRIREWGVPQKAIMHDHYIMQFFLINDYKVIYDRTSHITRTAHGSNVSVRKKGFVNQVKKFNVLRKKGKNVRLDAVKELLSLSGKESSISTVHRKELYELAHYKDNYLFRMRSIKRCLKCRNSRKMNTALAISILTGLF